MLERYEPAGSPVDGEQPLSDLTLRVRLGPAVLSLTCREYPPAVLEGLRARLACVAVDDADPKAIEVTLTGTGRHPLRYDTRVVAAADGRWVVRHDFALRATEACWRGATLWSPVAIEVGLRWVAIVELLGQKGLLLHASSGVTPAGGHLFLGRSGAGKTTIAQESDLSAVLCDEVSIVAPHNGEWYVWPSPFWGRETIGMGGHPAPLRGLWVLEGRDETSMRAVNGAAPIAAVYERIVDVGAAAGLPPLVLEAAAELAESIPVFELSWQRGDRVSSLLDEGARTGTRTAGRFCR